MAETHQSSTTTRLSDVLLERFSLVEASTTVTSGGGEELKINYYEKSTPY